jgi:hypothetical protein
MEMAVVCDIYTTQSERHFGGGHCLHHQQDRAETSLKTDIYILLPERI